MGGGHTFELDERAPTPEEYARLRRSAGWNDVDAEGVGRGLAGSLYSVCLLRDGEVVGCARVVGDGGIYFYIQDVIVLEEYRGRRHGRRLMDAVMAWLRANVPPGSFVGLMAARGYAGFYEAYGFAERAPDAPGMFLRPEG